ncbi:MAG: fibronectin type III domain-containing protein [Victivallales bacterium]|jgi:hypothetical protein
MKSKESGKAGIIGLILKGRQISFCLIAFILALAMPARAYTGSVLGWNNLGMHCADGDFSVLCLLPPYNTINSQVIDSTGQLITGQGGVSVTYKAIADPRGSINKTSIGKTNFWDYEQSLFGVSLQPDTGLPVPGPNSFSMPGAANVPKAMSYEAAYDWMAAYGIPITSTDDAGNTNTYPLMRLTGKNGSTAIAIKDIVLPVSTEINCKGCHASGSGDNARPAAGWVNDPDEERDFRLNILRLHDDLHLGTPAYASALASGGFNPAGLYANVNVDNKPILCAGCHLSEALPGSGQAGITPLTRAIHTLHANVTDPVSGLSLDSVDNRTGCYWCHPGSKTKCLRGVMGRSVSANGQLAIQCQSCHGTMTQVGSPVRTGWLQEPNCQACHTGDAVANSGQIRYENVFTSGSTMRTTTNQRFATNADVPAAGYSLYRFSIGHGGLYCQACHNSTHAEFPSIDDNDNIASKQQQGYIGPIAECKSCHGTTPNTVSGGPHGLHPIGQSWVDDHQENAGSSCQECHGTDYRGTVLSRSRTNRTLSAFGSKVFWRGFQIGCYNCHNGPNSENATSNTPPAVKNLTAATTSGKSAAVSLLGSDANGNPLTFRIVSQPANGTAGLSGAVLTYFADPEFAGTDTVTYAAWDGSTNSNLGTVSVKVAKPRVPGAPTAVTAARGNMKATVSFKPPISDGGEPITLYTVTSSPSGFTATGIGSPIEVTGLKNGISYRFAVKAKNAVGTGLAAWSQAVIPTTVPDAPTIGTPIAGVLKITIPFTVPASNGGRPITGYTVRSVTGGIVKTGMSSPIIITGLTYDVPYQFNVTAKNEVGESLPSGDSVATKPKALIPGAPTAVTAARGNMKATVSFKAPISDGGAAISLYTVTSSPAGFSATGTASPIEVAGLKNGTAYRFKVVATNPIGNGPASSLSPVVIPATVPDAPTIGIPVTGSLRVTVPFSVPASNGGSPITGYTVTSTPGDIKTTRSASPIIVTGLAHGTTYTFTVTAKNAVGVSAPSAAVQATP